MRVPNLEAAQTLTSWTEQKDKLKELFAGQNPDNFSKWREDRQEQYRLLNAINYAIKHKNLFNQICEARERERRKFLGKPPTLLEFCELAEITEKGGKQNDKN
jgi:hypothetical protein